MARILIAEDDPRIASFVEKGLRANGFTTLVADDGEQAQSLGLTDEFDLLILDIGLPEPRRPSRAAGAPVAREDGAGARAHRAA